MASEAKRPLLVHKECYAKGCAFCGEDLKIEEGVMIYDKNWYHNKCWNSFEKQQEVLGLD